MLIALDNRATRLLEQLLTGSNVAQCISSVQKVLKILKFIAEQMGKLKVSKKARNHLITLQTMSLKPPPDNPSFRFCHHL